MIKPSSDGLSADNWYAGIEYLDVHYANGPINRFFYYLSQGAPSSSADMRLQSLPARRHDGHR